MLEIGSHWFPVDLEEAKYAATNIFLNEARLERNNTSIAFLANEIITVFHELQHARQMDMVRSGISSKEILQFAKESALLELANRNNSLSYFGEYYEKNHDVLFIENNANAISVAMFFDVIKNNIKMNTLYINELTKKLNTNIAYSLNPEIQDMCDDIIEPYIDSNLLTVYPILQKEYNMDGTRKSSKQLVSGLVSELDEISKNKHLDETEKCVRIKDCNEMYYEVIYKAIKRENPSLEDIEALNEIYGNDNLIPDIKRYFEEQIIRIQESEQYLRPDKQTQISNYYQNKLGNLPEISIEWSFIEDEGQEEAKNRKEPEEKGYDYNNPPKIRPKEFQRLHNKKIKFNIADIKKAFGIADITLSEYQEEVKDVKKQAIEQTKENDIEHKRNSGEQSRE